MLFFSVKDMFPYDLDLQQSESLKQGKWKLIYLLAIWVRTSQVPYVHHLTQLSRKESNAA